MATKKEEKTTAASAPVGKKEDEYSLRELAAAGRKVFNVESECVIAALKGAGKETFSVTEAKALIDNFMKKEVK